MAIRGDGSVIDRVDVYQPSRDGKGFVELYSAAQRTNGNWAGNNMTIWQRKKCTASVWRYAAASGITRQCQT